MKRRIGKRWAVALAVGAVLAPLALLAQQQPSTQGQPQPLGQGFVLQGQQNQSQQGQGQQDQTLQGTQIQAETQTQAQAQTQIQTQIQTQAETQTDETQQATAPTTDPQNPPQDATGVKLEGLDKITARTFAIEAKLNETVKFGYLEITARRCVVSSEEDTPERTAFLEVVEAKPGHPALNVFSGWMFASSPSVSAMEHPVYDIWVVDCSGYKGEPSATAASETETKPEAPVEGTEQLPLD